MRAFKVGQKAKVVELPVKGTHLIGEAVTILPVGGFGVEDDDVVVATEAGTMLFLKERQLAKLEEQSSWRRRRILETTA